MNKLVLKMALAQTAEQKIFENIPEKLPQAEVSEKFKNRVKNFDKKKNKFAFIAAAIAIVLLASPVIANQFKSRMVTNEIYTASDNTTKANNESLISSKNDSQKVDVTSTNKSNETESVLTEDDLVISIDDISKATTNKSNETITYSKEYQDNLMAGSKQLSILKSIEGFDDYHAFYDDNGRLNILYWDNESLEIMKKHLDTNVVIFKKVKFSNDYLLSIQYFLNNHMKEYDIVYIGSGDRNNQVRVGITDESKKDDILELLHKNIENFDEEAVRFEVDKGGIVTD